MNQVLEKCGLGRQNQFQIGDLRIGEDGSFLGTATFRRQTVTVLLQLLPLSDNNIPQWMLSIKYPNLTNDLIPREIRSAMRTQIDLGEPIFTVGMLDGDLQIDSGKMSPVCRSFYQSLYENNQFQVTLKPGVRISAAATIRPQITQKLRSLRFEIDDTIELEGTLLKKFPTDMGSVLAITNSNGKSLLGGISFRATMPKFTTPIPPQIGNVGVTSGNAYLEVTASPSIELGWNINLTTTSDPNTTHKFLTKMSLSADLFKQEGEVKFVAVYNGPWEDAFGVTNFDMERIALLVSIGGGIGDSGSASLGNMTIGGQCRCTIDLPGVFENGPKTSDMAGSIAIPLESLAIPKPTDLAVRFGVKPQGGIPPKGILQIEQRLGTQLASTLPGPTDGLSLKEYANLIEYLITTAGEDVDLKTDNLPNVRLENFYFRFAPGGGDEDLQIADGLGLSGDLIFEGNRFSIRSDINWTDNPSAMLELQTPDADMQLKGISVTGIDLKMLLSSSAVSSSYFKVKGAADVLGSSKSVDITLEKDQFSLFLKDKVNGVFESDIYSLYSQATGRWDFEAVVTSEYQKIGQVASDALVKEANKALESLQADRQKRDDLDRKRGQLLNAFNRVNKFDFIKKADLGRKLGAAETEYQLQAKAVAVAEKTLQGSIQIVEQAGKSQLFVVHGLGFRGTLSSTAMKDTQVKFLMDYSFAGQRLQMTETIKGSDLKIDQLAAKLVAKHK